MENRVIGYVAIFGEEEGQEIKVEIMEYEYVGDLLCKNRINKFGDVISEAVIED